ncbi:MAG TPA: ribokinase [Acidimicrobiia bacterium]
MADVVVVGSINHDLTVLAPHHPHPGETVMGLGHYGGSGGKGANQAMAAARAGATVAMIGMVGDDEHGRALTRALADEGIDVGGVGVDPVAPTGLAVITLDDQAENTIVVSPGANCSLSPEWVEASPFLRSAPTVLAQLEVPLQAVEAAASIAAGLFILNAAPARELPRGLLERVDVLVLNRSELAMLTGVMSERVDRVGSTARLIEGPGSVVVTLGAKGAVVISRWEVTVGAERPAVFSGSEVTHLESPVVEVVDTTGAGDAFCGALAASLAGGKTFIEAVTWAVAAGALACSRAGAQAAMPTAAEIADLLARE